MTPEQVRQIVVAAAAAPSVHNTQPWLFRYGGGALEVRADRRRSLPLQDPCGRELLLSCGAASLHAELAVRGLGRFCDVDLLPDQEDPDLVVRLTPGPAQELAQGEARLLDAAPHRHTHRGALSPVSLPPVVLHALADQAGSEGVSLHVLDPMQATELALLAAHAQAGVLEDPAAVAERRAWARQEVMPADGLPADVVPGWAGGNARGHGVRDITVPTGTVAVLSTAHDDLAAWVRAGRALARVLLQTTSSGVAASPWTLALEVEDVRSRLSGALGLVGAPQMVLRLGYPLVGVEATTGRRAVREVLRTA